MRGARELAVGQLRARLGGRAPAFLAAWAALAPLEPLTASEVLSSDLVDVLLSAGRAAEEALDSVVADSFSLFRGEVELLANLERRRRGALSATSLEDALVVFKRARVEEKKEVNRAKEEVGLLAGLPLSGRLPRPPRLVRLGLLTGAASLAKVDEGLRVKWALWRPLRSRP